MKNKVSYFLSRRLTAFWEEIYRNNNNQECLILGSGSSLKSINLEAFEGIPLITCNLNMYLESFKFFNCILVNIGEPYMFAFNSKLYLKILGLVKKNCKEEPCINLMKDWSREIKKLKDINFLMHITSFSQFYRYPNVKYFLRSCYEGANNRVIPNDLLSLDNFGGAFYSCLTSAYLAGFKKCYIFGFDSFTLAEASPTRFYNEDQEFMEYSLNHSRKVFYDYLSKEMCLQVLTLPGQNALINSIEIKSKFRKINYKRGIDGFNLFAENKRKLIYDVNNIWIKNQDLSSSYFYSLFNSKN